MIPPTSCSEPFSNKSFDPTIPTFGTLSKVDTSSSNQLGRTSVSLLRKNKYFPRALAAPLLQERTKPWFLALRTNWIAPEATNPANKVSSREESSTTIISKLHLGRFSEIDFRQL